MSEKVRFENCLKNESWTNALPDKSVDIILGSIYGIDNSLNLSLLLHVRHFIK